MKTKIQIKSVFGDILFEYEKEGNTIAKTLLEAIKNNADLRNANLSSADLRYADLSNANLRNANLSSADLRYADLSYADLSYADLSYANLSGVKANESTCMFFPQCPAEGSFIGWKKANGIIVKLRITESAKRSSATSLKCRCSEAKVLDIQNIDGSSADIKTVSSDRYKDFKYTIGETVKVDDFDENRWNECSTGIHFFISREAAVQYR